MSFGWTTTHKLPKAFTVKDLLLQYENHIRHRSTKTTMEKLPFYLSKLESLSLIDANALPIRLVEELHESMIEIPYTANRTLAVLKAAYNFGIRRELVSRNPALPIRRYPEHRRESWISPEYMPKFLKLAQDGLSSDKSTQWAALLFALYTGQRRANILQITAKNLVSPNKWLIPANEHKGKRNTIVYLSSYAREALPIRESGRLFPIYEVRRVLWEVEEEIGLKISMHSMRHTFVSYAFRARLSPVVVSKLTGHSVGFTASQYGHTSEEELIEGVERVGEEIKKAGLCAR